MKFLFPVILFLICKNTPVMSQMAADTMKLELTSAEKIFLDSNLSLLTQHYNIDINKALERQARLWDNPYLQLDQSLYDGKWFRHGVVNGQQYGQIYIQLQQLIRTGGKRNKLIKISEDNTLSSTEQFEDIMRNLHFLLVTNFNTLYQLQQIVNLFDRELISINRLISGMDSQLALGNISVKENLRVKSLQYSLQSTRSSYQLQVEEIEGELRKLLAFKNSIFIEPIISVSSSRNFDSVKLLSIIDSAMINRPDIKLANTAQLFNQHNLAYQKSLVYPDVNVGVEYDRLNSYVPNFWGLTTGLPIPLWNRNSGNIKAAKLSLEQSGTGIREVTNIINQEVNTSFLKWKSLQNLIQNVATDFLTDYDKIAAKMLESYQQRQVNLIEFLDFFAAYRDTRINQLSQYTAFRNSMAEVNYTTASKIFNLR